MQALALARENRARSVLCHCSALPMISLQCSGYELEVFPGRKPLPLFAVCWSKQPELCEGSHRRGTCWGRGEAAAHRGAFQWANEAQPQPLEHQRGLPRGCCAGREVLEGFLTWQGPGDAPPHGASHVGLVTGRCGVPGPSRATHCSGAGTRCGLAAWAGSVLPAVQGHHLLLAFICLL